MLVAKKALRERFLKLPTVVTDEELKWLVFFLFTTLFVFDILNIVLRFYNCPWIRYVRGFLLDMLGNTMFADSSGDGIPLWYLSMIENLDEPRNYNWGGAVLAYLYRNLCLASSPSCHSMHGPTMLLQHWSWTRFKIHRPLPGLSHPVAIWYRMRQGPCRKHTVSRMLTRHSQFIYQTSQITPKSSTQI